MPVSNNGIDEDTKNVFILGDIMKHVNGWDIAPKLRNAKHLLKVFPEQTFYFKYLFIHVLSKFFQITKTYSNSAADVGFTVKK